MCVLYCHTTKHIFRSSAGSPLTFTDQARCFIYMKKRSNTNSLRTDIKVPQSFFQHCTHTQEDTHIFVWWDRQKSHVGLQCNVVLINTNSLSQQLSPPVWLVLQKCSTCSVFPPLEVLQLCTKPELLNLPQLLLLLHTELLWSRRRGADTQKMPSSRAAFFFPLRNNWFFIVPVNIYNGESTLKKQTSRCG